MADSDLSLRGVRRMADDDLSLRGVRRMADDEAISCIISGGLLRFARNDSRGASNWR